MSSVTVQARDVAQEFGLRFGRRAKVSRAPGRVNLIGEHTDYNDGFVMPAALDFATLVAAAPRDDRTLRVYSLFMDETREADLDALSPSGRHDWSDYVFGVAAMLEQGGVRLAGADLVVWSDVPLGAGLEFLGGARSRASRTRSSPPRAFRSSRWRRPGSPSARKTNSSACAAASWISTSPPAASPGTRF